jgi:uncharacterized protein YndB with AHSA1/START domain
MTIAIIVLVAIVGILAFASTKPDTINIQRIAEIKAPPERIFALIDDFHNWPAWAPHDKMDPTMNRTYVGAARGKGASSEWTSRGRAGSGRMEIIEATDPFIITISVDFTKPFEAHNINEFTLERVGDLTSVTWAMRGTNPYIAKLMSIFLNVDTMMGKHFEAGLQSLKSLTER